jgi:nucleoside-diphosphate-sugar epimerase
MLIIITGGLGFLGSSLANKLCKLGYKVIILDKKKNFSNKFSKNVKIYSGCDITSIDSLSKIKIKKPNIILHCAGQASAAKSFEIPRKDLDTNIIGTFNIISWAKKNFTKKIIYALEKR